LHLHNFILNALKKMQHIVNELFSAQQLSTDFF
jgi:hypothetical protein